MMKGNRLYFVSTLLIGIWLPSSLTHAEQYFTEDAETTEFGKVEMLPSITDDKTRAFNTFFAPYVETDIGVFPNVEFHMIPTGILFTPRKGSSHYGYGDMELGIKYRFIQETKSIPQVAFYPKVTLPSGNARVGTGLGGPTESPALWVLKIIGDWRLSGGGGYTFVQAPKVPNFAFGGILAECEIIKDFRLGGELYAQGRTLPNYGSMAILTIGGSYNFTKTLALQISVGHSIAGAQTLSTYIGFDWTWTFMETNKPAETKENEAPDEKKA